MIRSSVITTAVTIAILSIAASAQATEGKAIYDKTCATCHNPGLAGAPKLGDKAAWKDRIQQGNDALYKSALNGKGVMPPKGGNASLGEADIKAAVDYMVSQGQ